MRGNEDRKKREEKKIKYKGSIKYKRIECSGR